MSNMLFCPLNVIDLATLSADPVAIETLPVTNLQLPYRARTFCSSSTAQQQIKGTWGGQGHYMNFLALYRHNLSPAATIRVQIFSDLGYTNQIYDSGTVAAYSSAPLGSWQFGTAPLGSSIFDGMNGLKFSVFYFNRIIAGSFIITINDAGNPDGFMEASRLFGGDAFTLQWNPNTLEFGVSEGTAQSRTPTGSLRREPEEGFRAGGVSIKFTDENQRDAFMAACAYAGLRKDMFFSIFPGAGGRKEWFHTFIGVLVGRLPRVKQQANSNVLTLELNMEETA